MKKFAMVSVSLAVLASPSAFAQSKTRAEVYQELIEAQQNGLNYVTESSYPEVSPIFTTRVAQLQQERLAKQNAAQAASTRAANRTAN
jgi:Domain of unknown function (DUF4148)